MSDRFRRQLEANDYPGYVYGYPHKKAYRTLARRPLDQVWADEPTDHLFCYVHIPFCNQRCSFCNLFTYVPGSASPTERYLDALEREMTAYAKALGSFEFRRLYLGGGTPTYLTSDELRRLVRALHERLEIRPNLSEACIEASPESLDEEKVETLRELGFLRLSLGIQSFVPSELQSVNRAFEFERHRESIRWISRSAFPRFNLDLIYGLPGQTLDTWQQSLDGALESPANSLFLYPLYVRPMTGLGQRNSLESPTPTQMGEMYDLARERAGQAGFTQMSMRQFRRDSGASWDDDEHDYLCQRDGMVGLGAGARSYTRRLHYSTPWKMLTRNIRDVVEEYTRRMTEGDTDITHGYELSEDEQRRRYVIQCLLSHGVRSSEFEAEFRTHLESCFSGEFSALREERCVTREGDLYALTARGIRHADIVGQLFFSPEVRSRMEAYQYDQ